MFATSVPLPPTGTPPAFAGVAFFGVLFASGVGVAGGAGLRAVVRFFSGAGMSVGFVSARFGGVAGVGVGAGGSRVTAPIERGPGGAAIRCTLYTGGSAFGADGRAMMDAEMSAECSTTEIPNGPPSRALLSRRDTPISPTAPPRARYRQRPPGASPRARERHCRTARFHRHEDRRRWRFADSR